MLWWKSNVYYARARACARVALFIQHSTRMRHIVSGFSGPTTRFKVISKNGTILVK
jgi:hypothetical protein